MQQLVETNRFCDIHKLQILYSIIISLCSAPTMTSYLTAILVKLAKNQCTVFILNRYFQQINRFSVPTSSCIDLLRYTPSICTLKIVIHSVVQMKNGLFTRKLVCWVDHRSDDSDQQSTIYDLHVPLHVLMVHYSKHKRNKWCNWAMSKVVILFYAVSKSRNSSCVISVFIFDSGTPL